MAGASISGGALEGVRKLQDAPLVPMTADDLQADRQPAGGKSRRDRDRRVRHHRHIPAGAHPVDIGRHRGAGNRGGIRCVDVEGFDLGHRQDEVLIALEKLTALIVHERLPRLRAADIRPACPLRFSHFKFDRVFHPLGPLPDERRITRMIADEAKERKCFGNAAEVRFRVLDHTSEILKDLPIGVDDAADFRFERDPAQPAPPGDTNTFEVSSRAVIENAPGRPGSTAGFACPVRQSH